VFPPLVSRTGFGLHSPQAELYLDARRAPGLVFVSHAHSDHCSSAKRIVCTTETADLHRRLRGPREATTLAYGQPLTLGSATLELAPAGHTLGSAMAVVRCDAGTLVYTGDYKLRPSAFSTGVPVPRCDVLVMECTFGDPRYRFPPESEVLQRLYAFIDECRAAAIVPVVLAYAFGKSQEALFHLTSHGYRVAVHGPAAALCRAHEELGYLFPGPGSWKPHTAGEDHGDVLLMTPHGRRDLPRNGRRYRFVHLSGWACSHATARFVRADLALPLSGHADFDELVRTATESGARKVYTVHGSPRFAAQLRRLGVDAEHLHSGQQAQQAASLNAAPRALPSTPAAVTQLSLALG
jgi:putative mRNA 3-end processing factor